MKTKELKRIAEECGFTIVCGFGYYTIKNSFGEYIARVNRMDMLQIDTDFYTWDRLDETVKRKLFDLLVEYAKTPINEREEETKFYLRHKYINKRNAYLVVDENQNCSLQVMGVDYELPTSDKAKFTEKEIENIKDYNKTDLKDFEMIEVEI